MLAVIRTDSLAARELLKRDKTPKRRRKKNNSQCPRTDKRRRSRETAAIVNEHDDQRGNYLKAGSAYTIVRS